MPISPVGNQIPSESTIEVMTNHYILHHLNKSHAWIFTPTRRQEKRLGYDASLQNAKVAVIQYKRIRRHAASVSIDLRAAQHATLMRVFQPQGRPYVFYCFSTYRTYAALNADYYNVNAPLFFENSLFFSAHLVPAGCTTIRFTPPGTLEDPASGTIIPYYDGLGWVFRLSRCWLGLEMDEFEEATQPETVTTGYGRVNVLLWRMGRVAATASR